MKNPKDHIKEISLNTQEVTSLAYWLTSEGLNNPIEAAMLRDSINNSSDEEFAVAFDGATKVEATNFLTSWELCYMQLWGAPELLKAIVLSDEGRNKDLTLRAVSLAQSVDELPSVFTPAIGIKWAMDKSYLINRSICEWVGIEVGTYGHPHNTTQSIAETSTIKTTTTTHKIKNRTHILDAEIMNAKGKALNEADSSSVWNELVKMANNKAGCLLGMDEEAIKYQDGDDVKFFKKKNLSDRMSRALTR